METKSLKRKKKHICHIFYNIIIYNIIPPSVASCIYVVIYYAAAAIPDHKELAWALTFTMLSLKCKICSFKCS